MRAPEAGDRPLGREALSVATAPEPLPGISGSTGGLDAIVSEAIERSPALWASWADFEAALQRIPQVTSLSDPQVMATIPIEEVQTRTGPQEFILGIQQRFPWFGVLDLRGQVAWEMAQERLQRYLTDLLDTVRRVQGLWWEIAYQQSARQIATEEIDLLEGFADVAASRYSTGIGSQQAVLRAELEISRAEEQLITIEERISSLTSDLNSIRDSHPLAPVEIPPLSAADVPTIELDLTALIASAEALRPEIAELRHRLSRHERERQLARSQYFPNFTLGANWIAVGGRPDNPAMSPPDEGQDAYSVVVGASIPLWWRAYRAAVEEAERNIAATEERLRDTENRISNDIFSAHFAMTEASDLMDLYASTLIPLAEQTLEASEAGFATGQLTFLDLVDAERMFLRLRLAHEQARRDYLLALADVERAVGAALIPHSHSTAGASQEVTQP
ncbi:TolC family protein [Candidatus Sumerlaeota bacterium]|nr:TolC family protein [Candidatus Sumerlaeota bacterium]